MPINSKSRSVINLKKKVSNQQTENAETNI